MSLSLGAKIVGLGDPHAQFNVYIANRPNFYEYSNLDCVVPVTLGEIFAVGQTCGNGWRKVFNVYAKLVFALNVENIIPLQGAQSWQRYRDDTLLQSASNTNLLFSKPQLTDDKNKNCNFLHIVMGKTYAKSLRVPLSLTWLDHEFAMDKDNRLLVCPYFDYRQLSNVKITHLVELIKSLT